jgi:hypothetical protein
VNTRQTTFHSFVIVKHLDFLWATYSLQTRTALVIMVILVVIYDEIPQAPHRIAIIPIIVVVHRDAPAFTAFFPHWHSVPEHDLVEFSAVQRHLRHDPLDVIYVAIDVRRRCPS